MKERGQKVKRNLSGFLLPICSVWAESAWRCLLSFGFAIKTASILVMKKQACVLLYLLRWRPRHGCYQTQQKGGRESWISPGTNIPERCICFLFTALSPPFPHHHRRHPPHLPSWTDRQCSVPQLVLLVRQVGLSPFFFFFFANGLICWGMGEGVKGSPNFTGDGFTLLSFISN